MINIKGKLMFDRVILDRDGEIPAVFRSGLLRNDSMSDYLRSMSEINSNDPRANSPGTNNNDYLDQNVGGFGSHDGEEYGMHRGPLSNDSGDDDFYNQ